MRNTRLFLGGSFHGERIETDGAGLQYMTVVQAGEPVTFTAEPRLASRSTHVEMYRLCGFRYEEKTVAEFYLLDGLDPNNMVRAYLEAGGTLDY